MSICKNYYVIVGYDLTGYQTDKFDEWVWTEAGERYINNKTKGRIQLFDDPMSGDYLYLGYILSAGDQFDFNTTKFGISTIENYLPYVAHELIQLQSEKIISKEIKASSHQVIVFEECT